MIDNGKAQRTGSLQRERNGVWTMRVSFKGKKHSRTSGTKDLGEAKAKLAKFVADVERGYAQKTGTGKLLAEWSRYESSAQAARMSPAMRANRYRAWLYFAEWMHETNPDVGKAQDVTGQMAEAYMTSFGENRAAMTVNLCAGHLRGIFRVLLGVEAERSNPLNWVAPRFPDTRPRRELSAAEVRRVVNAAGVEGGEWPRLVAIAIYTGLRLGDCCRLRWENLDLGRGVIRVVPHKTRRYYGGTFVTIPMHSSLKAALGATPRELRTGYVLPVTAENYASARWRISSALARIFDNAGIARNVRYEGRIRRTPFATFHSLRHSFVSFAANAGVPLVVVQAIVGHSSAEMTRHYYHASETALRRAVQAIPSFGERGGCIRKAGASPSATGGCGFAAPRRASVSSRLAGAKRLFEAGRISECEYARVRARIIDEL